MTELTCPRCSEPCTPGASRCSHCALPLNGPQLGLFVPESKPAASLGAKFRRILLWLTLLWVVLTIGVLLYMFLAPTEDGSPSGANASVLTSYVSPFRVAEASNDILLSQRREVVENFCNSHAGGKVGEDIVHGDA